MCIRDRPNLDTGAIDVVSSPALAAEQLKWSSQLDHVGSEVGSYSIGAVVLSSKRIDALPADLKAIVLDTGKVATAALLKRIRNEDDAAFERLKTKMTVVSLTADEKDAWTAVYKKARQRLGKSKSTFSPDLVKKLERLGK